jgi:hypothetical protein
MRDWCASDGRDTNRREITGATPAARLGALIGGAAGEPDRISRDMMSSIDVDQSQTSSEIQVRIRLSDSLSES